MHTRRGDHAAHASQRDEREQQPDCPASRRVVAGVMARRAGEGRAHISQGLARRVREARETRVRGPDEPHASAAPGRTARVPNTACRSALALRA